MCDILDKFPAILQSQLFAAVVGALIGILPAFGLSLLRENQKEKKSYRAWLSGLCAELNHIQKCIKEISEITKNGKASTKKMKPLKEKKTAYFFNPSVQRKPQKLKSKNSSKRRMGSLMFDISHQIQMIHI